MKDKLTIIIPCKNEEKYIGKVLESLLVQDGIRGVRIIIADSNSTDSTLSIVDEYSYSLNIEVIQGGLPAIARNRGADISITKYLLFIDADAEILDIRMISKSLNKMERKDLHLLSSHLNSHYLFAKFLYKLNNLIVFLSKFDKPFCVGIYMMIRRDVFKSLGGFPEDVFHCEDYLLSKRVDRKKFGIINKDAYSDNRRFKKMGYWKMIKYLFKNIINRNNYDYFKKDVGYWS